MKDVEVEVLITFHVSARTEDSAYKKAFEIVRKGMGRQTALNAQYDLDEEVFYLDE